ncbi:MAG TPA: hypothetical protein ENO16_04465 [Chromatiales bacterium]|nr:hypothetical protein [Chromatiales bacterium]
MNKPTIEEAVSALLDDALNRHEFDQLLQQLRQVPHERERMGRYSLIGMAMRGEFEEIPTRDMTAGIMARIRAEDAVPRKRLPALGALRDWLDNWRVPAFGMALAATVAGVAVLVIQPVQDTPDARFVVLGTPQAQQASVEAPRPAAVQVAAQDADGMPDPYLVQHLTYAEGGPMNSMSSNVRLVAYERP